ncbi:MAG TPA: ubiquinol-cytochrome c reductase cytochrome b subunit [Nocardioidaceae bacterium]|nr:ubiquinol-cytochrome c reductase cytochrome b subunit [Nocardioidaceae bacterium]
MATTDESATRAPRTAASNGKGKGNPVSWLDDRIGLAYQGKILLRKVFPDHWSFMLGEIALWSFVILLLTGTFLSLWFVPSMSEIVYHGPYHQLNGIHMSEAYASTLHISFDVRGGLLMRQIHHWSANIFIAAMTIHMLRIFFTGAFRKPREINWLIGLGLLMLGILEGFAGYSLPDDLLSGTGLRIADGIIRSIPVVGTYLEFFIFGGQFPGDVFISRLYIVHVLLIPGILLALISAHMILLFYQKHTQWPGPGHTNENVVGAPFFPIYTAKAGGFFFMVFGVTALLGAVLQINPIWMYGPYDPSQVTAGSQPDWYMGWLEGALRIMPNWETHIGGFTISWNVLIPGAAVMGVLFTLLAIYPFLERWITGDNRDHHILDRPRNQPTRTGLGVAGVTAYGLLWLAGGNDIIATHFHVSLNAITWFMRFAVFVGPVITFIIARRWAISLQRSDEHLLLHGYETGVIIRSPEGGYSEIHAPLSQESAYQIASRERRPPVGVPELEDEYGVRARGTAAERVRGRLHELWFGDEIPKPTAAELEEAHHHESPEGPLLEDGGHHGIESGGQIGGEEFDLEESSER